MYDPLYPAGKGKRLSEAEGVARGASEASRERLPFPAGYNGSDIQLTWEISYLYHAKAILNNQIFMHLLILEMKCSGIT